MSTSRSRIGALLQRPLIEALNDIFPHRCADPKDPEREIWMKAGERRLVDFLESAHAESTDVVLTGQS